MSEVIAIVGLHGGVWYGVAAEQALRSADVLVGARRQLDDLAAAELTGERVELARNLDATIELCVTRSGRGERVCVVASGDPGFFGIARLLGARLGPDALVVHPAPSAVSLAFARVGLSWDDALVATCHGRLLDAVVPALVSAPKAAVLVSPESPPEALGRALVAADCRARDVWVCARLGEADESVVKTDLAGLAAGCFDPFSVVLLMQTGCGAATSPGLAWGLPEAAYEHAAGMITKAEVRAVVLSKLGLPIQGVLWDVGAGSGSVSVEAARLAPGVRVFAIERDTAACERIRRNAGGSAVSVVQGAAPSVFDELPDPDRVFVGGGGIDVLDAALARVRPGGGVVATFAVMATAVAAAERLGSLAQINVSRGSSIGAQGAMRLAAENPVFVVWGPR